jgi:ABC-type spermidine/putrescine transport system permease subunit II
VQFNTELSGERYPVVISLFDQMVTFRLKELQAATKSIHEATAALKARPNTRGSELLAQARSLAYTPLVGAENVKNKEFLELFRKSRRDVAVSKELTGMEQMWSDKSRANYERAASWPMKRAAWPNKPSIHRPYPACATLPAHARKDSHACQHPAIGRARRACARRALSRMGPWIAFGLILAFLLVFLLLPVGTVIYTAFVTETGALTLGHFGNFFGQSVFRESFFNSLWVALASTFFASVIAVPLAYLTVRFEFRGALAIQTLGVLPLIMPPFVGAVALQLIFGKNGSVNLLLDDWLGFTIPIMDGLVGVTFVESIHYFPFILLNLVASMRNIDGAMEESALNLGARGWRLFRRVIFPLAMPGYLAGAALVFVKVFDDLGTPLVMGITNMLAPQAYLRITSVGVDDPLGYVISVIMIGFSILALWLAARVMKGRDYATLQKGGGALQKRRLGQWESVLAYGWIVAVLLIVLAPHLGILLMSFAQVWSSALPDAYTLEHYATVFSDAKGMIGNTCCTACWPPGWTW